MSLPFDRYEPVIGVEVHIQLATASKIFCRCAHNPQSEPNSNLCELCTGQPGSLPVLNEQVVSYALMVGLSTNCTINQVSEFSRKHYFYPDLPKGFQITQADKPIAENGYLIIRTPEAGEKRIRIRRIHIEEDAGKNIHATGSARSFVDLNRAGTPLLEIVTEPDLRSAAEVRAYLQELHALVTSLGVCSGNMEEGAFRADTNISVRPHGVTTLGTRCELKNINSFKFIFDATTYEINRHRELLEQGEKITQQTRLWDTKQRCTVAMRSKEEAADYRYMPEPDLPLLCINDERIQQVRATLPELPAQRAERYIQQNQLTPYEAEIIAYNTDLSRYYEIAQRLAPGKTMVNWILRDLLGYLKEHEISLEQFAVKAEQFAELISLIDTKQINARTGQEVFLIMAETGKSAPNIVQERGLTQMGSSEELYVLLQEIIAQHPQQVADYRAGKIKLWGFFVGKAMEKTKGRAQPELIQEILQKLLS